MNTKYKAMMVLVDSNYLRSASIDYKIKKLYAKAEAESKVVVNKYHQ